MTTARPMRCLARGIVLALAALLAACASGPSPSAGGASNPPGAIVNRKVLTAAVSSQVPSLAPYLNPLDAAGSDVLVVLVNDGFNVANSQGALVARLADPIPTVDNGLWKVSPDGHMEITWKLRSGITWHDGAPFTAADAVFTNTVYHDRDAAEFFDPRYANVNDVQAPDPHTVVVSFNRPYIDGDKLFYWIMPEHLAAQPYRDDKASFTSLALWRDDFVGTGPFKVKEWDPGTQVIFDAFDAYYGGRPKLDQIVVRFIPDANTLVANLLSGAVDTNLGRGLVNEQAMSIESSWADGRVRWVRTVSIHIWPELEPTFASPSVIATDARFRKALISGLDRQEMVDTFLSGRSTVATPWFSPDDADYPLIEKSLVRYDFDPRLAGQLLEEMGYVRGADGMFHDSTGQPLSVELRTTTRVNEISTISDYWKRIGVDTAQNIIPRQLAQDLDYRTHFPGFDLIRSPSSPDVAVSAQLRTPENHYGGSNYPNYSNAQYDAMVDRYFSTIPRADRFGIAGQIVHWWSDQLIDLPLYYDIEAMATNNRIAGPTAATCSGPPGGCRGWNAADWDLKS